MKWCGVVFSGVGVPVVVVGDQDWVPVWSVLEWCGVISGSMGVPLVVVGNPGLGFCVECIGVVWSGMGVWECRWWWLVTRDWGPVWSVLEWCGVVWKYVSAGGGS